MRPPLNPPLGLFQIAGARSLPLTHIYVIYPLISWNCAMECMGNGPRSKPDVELDSPSKRWASIQRGWLCRLNWYKNLTGVPQALPIAARQMYYFVRFSHKMVYKTPKWASFTWYEPNSRIPCWESIYTVEQNILIWQSKRVPQRATN